MTINEFIAAINEQLTVAQIWFANQIAFSVDPDYGSADCLLGSLPLNGGTMTIRVQAAGDWDPAPKGEPIAAVNWSHASNGAFTCGTYSGNLARFMWDLASAVQFSCCAGDLPSEEG